MSRTSASMKRVLLGSGSESLPHAAPGYPAALRTSSRSRRSTASVISMTA